MLVVTETIVSNYCYMRERPSRWTSQPCALKREGRRRGSIYLRCVSTRAVVGSGDAGADPWHPVLLSVPGS